MKKFDINRKMSTGMNLFIKLNNKEEKRLKGRGKGLLFSKIKKKINSSKNEFIN